MEKISVLIATYNGEKYVKEQLKSILAQSMKPDEVIIKDDCSSDQTIKIVSDFISNNNLAKKWHLVRNNKNLGWKKNFVDGLLNYVSGDYIFFCDQDDFWMPTKIADMISCMRDHPEIGLLVSDFEIVDAKLQRDQKRHVSKSLLEKYVPKEKILYTYYPGCTYCFRKDYKKAFLDYWKPSFPHDSFLWHYTISDGSLYILHKELIKYRRHSGTQTGKKVGNIEERLSDLSYYSDILNVYKSNKKTYNQLKKYICNAKIMVTNRYNLLSQKDIRFAFNNIRYMQYYWSWKTFCADIYFAFQKKNI